ncbi:uncharacterized protein [Physcomitrium patens]|uniref:uncharacterized protein isoform X1 n=1 Tax=Physcomitrium patens TaxID=3218 RepID=UPI000D16A5B6|nr:uncharacterized protein LOC112282096 isoform X2 [Physcomitrium patens]|eukprot:XP_024375077.1 uncharacterized protein LOC112282096 isoform X2 [Physcomitrella patens]
MKDIAPMQLRSGSTGFITSTRTRRTMPASGETMKLEKEMQEKMRKLAEIRSNIALEQKVTEELRKDVSAKGRWSLNPMPLGRDKLTKTPAMKSLLQQPPPPNFKIKRSSTIKPPDSYQNENKATKLGPSIGHAQILNNSVSPRFNEEARCISAAEALKKWHDSGCVNPADVHQNRPSPQQSFHPVPVSIKSAGDSETWQPADLGTYTVPGEQPNRTWSTMDTQTDRLKQAAVEDCPTTIQGTYFQHLCNQDNRKVRS